MLQRAASNAYSWWWAGHVRTKQSKWLEQNLQDMGEKVKNVIKLIEEDGDSFAKRAEMYYKKRPELINFVEESYRAYRALAERYDHLSTELQHANSTLASVFPDQFQYSMDDEDEDPTHRFPRKPPSATDFSKNIPNPPKDPKELKGTFAGTPKQPQKLKHSSTSTSIAKSGLSKPQALQEIDKLQKEILALQTEKEFVKSSYENGLTKFWEIEEQINEKQYKVSNLQDEFGEGMIIEDNEARSLMTTAALKSCNERLVDLKQKHDKVSEEAKTEKKRVKDYWEKLSSLKGNPGQMDIKEPLDGAETTKSRDKPKITEPKESSAAIVKHNPDHVEVEASNNSNKLKISDQEKSSAEVVKQDLNLLKEHIKESFEAGPKGSITVTETVEKVDEIVNRVINLESTVLLQSSLVKRLRTENNELQTQIQNLEDYKGALIEDATNKSKRLREMEDKFHEIQELNRKLEEENKRFQVQFTEARHNLDHLYEKLPGMKPDEDLEIAGTSKSEDRALAEVKLEKEEQKEILNHQGDLNKLQGQGVKEADLKKAQSGEPKEAALNKLQGKDPTEDLGTKVKSTTLVVDSEVRHIGQEDTPVPDPGIREIGEPEFVDLSGKKVESSVGVKSQQEPEKQEIPSLRSSSGKVKDLSVTYEDYGKPKVQDKVDHNASSAEANDHRDQQNMETGEEKGAIDSACQKMSKNDVENKEVLVNEYTTLLQNYDHVNTKLTEVENKNGDNNLEEQIRELKSMNAMKDEEISSLHHKLKLLQKFLEEKTEMKNKIHQQKPSLLDESPTSKSRATSPTKKEESKVEKVIPVGQFQSVPPIEEKFQERIDALLEQSLSFLVRCSTSFNQIQKFESEVQDLQAELLKIEERVKKMDETSPERYNYGSQVRPIYKHMREIHAQLAVWLEKNSLLKDELKSRYSILCKTQEEIDKSSGGGSENDDMLASDQAAKFQGEILVMKQENAKVTDELQVSIEQMTNLQLKVERTLQNLDEEFKFSGSRGVMNPLTGQTETHHRVPLRAFIFGDKPKKQKPSFFSCVSPMFSKRSIDKKDSF